MVRRARLRACSGAVAGGAASRELPAVPAAPEAGQLLGRAGHGEAPKPAVQQLAVSPVLNGAPIMQTTAPFRGINRRALLSALALLPALPAPFIPVSAPAQTATSGGSLPSWND